jgi:acyl-CoA thioesterase
MSARAQRTAEAVGRFIAEGDLLARQLGVRLLEIRPGYARAVMTVRPDMVNAAGVGHGGATFTLADTAFAYACNSHNATSLAVNCAVTFLGPVEVGDVLTAEAREVSRQGRSGVCDVTVTAQDGRAVALFRGLSREAKGRRLVEEPED